MATRVWIGLALLAVLIAATPLLPANAAEDAVFKLQETTIFEEDSAEVSSLMRYGAITSQAATCRTTPLPDVTYPKLKSKTPLYGFMSFRMSSSGMAVRTTGFLSPRNVSGFHFVLDESEPGDAAAAKEKPSLLNELAQALTATRRMPTIATKYDTLYFDANGDKDLTNDPVKALNKQEFQGLSIFGGSGANTKIFEAVEVKSEGPPAVTTQFLPWLSVRSPQQAYLIFMSTVVHKGEIQIGGKSFDVVLGRRYSGPSASILLRSRAQTGQPSSGVWRPVPLNVLHQTDGKFYTLSLEPTGKTLTVSPYRGKYGTFRVASRDGEDRKLGAMGTLRSDGQMRIPVGDPSYPYTTDHPQQCQLPEGKYQPYYLTVDYGDVTVRLSYCYYDTSGQRMSQPPFGIDIREDQPFVLDFSTKPAAVFTTPAKGHVARPGDKIVFKAVIMDPELGFMVRGIYDTTREIGKRTARNAQGELVSVPRYATLNPTVSITDSAGKEVAAGPMPFG